MAIKGRILELNGLGGSIEAKTEEGGTWITAAVEPGHRWAIFHNTPATRRWLRELLTLAQHGRTADIKAAAREEIAFRDRETASDVADAKQYATDQLDKLCDALDELLEAAQSARVALAGGDTAILKDAKRVFQQYRIKGDALATGHGVVAAIEEVLSDEARGYERSSNAGRGVG